MLTTLIEMTGWPVAAVQIAIVGGWLGIVGAISEGLYLTTNVSPEVTRKVVHIGAGNVIILAWMLRIPGWIAIAAALLFSGIALLSYWLPILPGINSVGRHSLGTFFYAVSVGVLTATFWDQGYPQFTAIGILIMTWGDGLAALVGQRWGQHRYQLWRSQKSWEGSATMATVSGGVALITLGVAYGVGATTIAIAIVVAIVATSLEAFSWMGIDNLTVPVGSALLAYSLCHWLGLA